MMQKRPDGMCMCPTEEPHVRAGWCCLWQDAVIKMMVMWLAWCLVPLLSLPLGLNLVALLLSCLLWNITLSKKSRQADTVVTVCQQPRASGGDAQLDEETWHEGSEQQGQIAVALHVSCCIRLSLLLCQIRQLLPPDKGGFMAAFLGCLWRYYLCVSNISIILFVLLHYTLSGGK